MNELPFFANTKVVLGIFVVLLVFFDIVLIRIRKLNKKQWKRVDYFWLAFASLGIFGAAYDSRSIVALNFAETLKISVTQNFNEIHNGINRKIHGGVCRQLNQSELASEDEILRAQAGYDEACVWFKAISELIPKSLDNVDQDISFEGFPPPPKFHQTQPDVNDLREAISEFNSSFNNFRQMQDQIERNDLETLLIVSSPIFLALAFAIRITKVTGELKLGD